MGQWGRPAHKGIRHNQKVRGGGTWSAQDRRLKQHMHLRFWRKRGAAETWSSQVRHLDRGTFWRLEKLVTWILLAGITVVAVSTGGNVLMVAIVITLGVLGWRKVRG